MDNIPEQSIIFSDEYKDIESQFKKEAEKLRGKKCDASKSFQDQGLEHFANGLAADHIINILNTIRKEREQKFSAPKTYE